MTLVVFVTRIIFFIIIWPELTCRQPVKRRPRKGLYTFTHRHTYNHMLTLALQSSAQLKEKEKMI